jgi:hypothetical protein
MRNNDLFEARRTALSELFTEEHPLGPIQTPSDISMDEFDAIFDSDNQIWRSIKSHPAIVIGRKGAGKTAFLKGINLRNDGEVVVFLRSNSVFRTSLNVIQEFNSRRRLVFVEDIATVWQNMFWILIGFEILNSNNRRYEQYKYPSIASYIEQFNLDIDDDYETVFDKVLDIVHTNLANGSTLNSAFDGPAASIGFHGREKVTLRKYRELVESIFARGTGRSASILIDNMEEINFDIESLPDAVSGLLKAVSEFRRTKYNYAGTFCVPAELVHKMLEISSNPSKDFEHNILLQWRAGDLWKIATVRLAKYFFLFDHEFFLKNIDALDFSDRADIIKFWRAIFPEKVINGMGQPEPLMTYLMRHTQLLPRNILQILTEILKGTDTESPPFQFTERAVLEGLRKSEVILANEAFRGYRQSYPPLAKVCQETLNKLPVVFKFGDLHSVFNDWGKAASGFDDYFAFRRMLLETGVIGKVIEKRKQYIVGLFEYTLPNRLNVTEQDEFCVHPIFSGIYRARRSSGQLPIYPYGSDPEDRDFRHSMAI